MNKRCLNHVIFTNVYNEASLNSTEPRKSSQINLLLITYSIPFNIQLLLALSFLNQKEKAIPIMLKLNDLIKMP